MEIIPPRRREDIFGSDGKVTHRFIVWMESLTITANDSSSAIEDATKNAAESRNIDVDSINSKIARLNRKLDNLLKTLVSEIQALNHTEIAKEALDLQKEIKAELKLLNVRVEEAFETKITNEDLE